MAEKFPEKDRELNFFRRINDKKFLIETYVEDLHKKANKIGEKLTNDLNKISKNFINLKENYANLQKEKDTFEEIFKENGFSGLVKEKFDRVNIQMEEIGRELDHEVNCDIILKWDQRMMDQLDCICTIDKPIFIKKQISISSPIPKPRVSIYKRLTRSEVSSCNHGSGNGMLNSPSGIATNSSFLYICDTNNDRIQIFDYTASFIYKIQHPKLSHPISICVDANNIFLTQCQPDRVIKFSVTGSYTKHYSHIDHPTGICIHAEKLYVCSYGYKNIIVLDYDLNPASNNSILCEGELTSPRDVKVTDNEELIVLDWGESTFLFFTIYGHLLRKWSGDSILNIRFPGYFDIDNRNNFILLTDANRIFIFNYEGCCLHTIGNRQTLGRLTGITLVQKDSNITIIVVNQCDSNQLQIWH
ncbi:T9SS C-terminal target domain-containing protein [Oopsacas minuta]|uniref:T9SS C-terminal target domain-containing protein n=1 Tax=Oopsacas minuta TaxID=111878 RepID=A0AAV7KDT8_9METZ|nr:T9SS C-terminal target domain-containing protein [Oopsacas minuta]